MAHQPPPPSHNNLYGSCACERNQYEIAIPHNHNQTQSQHQTQAQAHVFFDNSLANRRSQAAPLTAWLRIPLAWYHSSTHAYYPDESHATIRRTFYTPASLANTNALSAGGRGGVEVRKQFCGFCGTHLNAWRESESEKEWMDVTLGSLAGDSLGVLEGLGWLEGSESGSGSEEEEEEEDGGRVRRVRRSAGSMSNRGMPFFEEMVEDSRLGRIKRRRGGGVGGDGREVVWEVVEVEGDGDEVMQGMAEGAAVEGGNGNKRLKMGD